MRDAAKLHESEIRRNYTLVCRCEYDDQDGFEVLIYPSRDCVIHGEVDDPLDALLDECEDLRKALREIAEFDVGVRLAPVAACKEIASAALGGHDA